MNKISNAIRALGALALTLALGYGLCFVPDQVYAAVGRTAVIIATAVTISVAYKSKED